MVDFPLELSLEIHLSESRQVSMLLSWGYFRKLDAILWCPVVSLFFKLQMFLLNSVGNTGNHTLA